jgi:hypothetical protein
MKNNAKFLMALLPLLATQAATNTWICTDTFDNAWSSPANWSGGNVPDTPAEHAVIPISTAPCLFDSGEITVGSISGSGDFILSGGTLTVASNSIFSGNVMLTDSPEFEDGGTLNGAGRLTLTGGGNQWATGMLALDVTIETGARLTLTAGDKRLGACTLLNKGEIVWQSDAIWLRGDCTLDNRGLFDVQGDLMIGKNYYDGDHLCTFLNSGELRKSAGYGELSLGVRYNWGYTPYYAYVNLLNTGLVDIRSGTLRLLGDGEAISDGEFRTAALTSLCFYRGTHILTNEFDFSGSGTVLVSNDTSWATSDILVYSSDTFAGTLVLYAETMSLAPDTILISDRTVLLDGTLTGDGTLRLAGTDNLWNGSSLTGGVTVDVPTGVRLALTGGPRNFGNATLLNEGTVVWTNGLININAAATIDNRGLFDVQGDLVMGKNYQDGDHHCTFLNSGELRKSAGSGVLEIGSRYIWGHLRYYGYVNIQNTGLMDIRSGTLLLFGEDSLYEGECRVPTGTTLWFYGGEHTLTNGCDITGSGSLLVSNETVSVTVSLNVNVSETFDGSLALRADTLRIGAGSTCTVARAELIDGALTGGGTLLLSGTDNHWSGSALAGDIVLAVAPEGDLALTGGPRNFGDATLLNEGTVVWTNGVININGDSTIDNRGLFDVQGDLTLGKNEAISSDACAFLNSGELRKSAGSGVFQLGGRYYYSYKYYKGYVNLGNTGLIDVRSGTLQRFGSEEIAQSGTMRIAAGATFRNRTGTGSTLLGQDFTSSGIISGSGVLDVGEGNTLANAGVVAPGDSAGMLTVTGNYSQATSGTLSIEIGGTTPGTQHDRLVVSGTAALGGTNAVVWSNSYAPESGDAFTPLLYASADGTFVHESLPVLPDGWWWEREEGAQGLTFTAQAPAEMTARGTPLTWYAGYNLNPEGGGPWTPEQWDTLDTSDADGDNAFNWQEFVADTDPTNSASYLHITAISNGPPVTVSFEPASTARAYTLQVTTNLVTGPWADVPGQGPRPGTGGDDAMSDDAGGSARFYRLKVEAP